MSDPLFLALTVALFALAVLYARWCAREAAAGGAADESR